MLTQIIAATAIAATGFQMKGSAVDSRIAWIQSAWSRAKKEGRPAAERTIRQFPERFKGLPKRMDQLSKASASTVANMKLEEKKAFLLELWRVRHSLNLMALLDPDVLEQLTGVDAKKLNSAIADANRLHARYVSKN